MKTEIVRPMKKNRQLEIAVFNIESAILAVKAGADRIELCENPQEGGTTASYGTLKLVKKLINIPVFPIIRPRGGDFLYSNNEFEIMKTDVVLCKRAGFEGIVLGILDKKGAVDVDRLAQLVSLAFPMEVTFHRAFDRVADPVKAMDDIIECGCRRILTSGQKPDAEKGKILIKQLVQKSDGRIIIMPGSGIRSNNIRLIADYTEATELHSSARKIINTGMKYINQSMKENLQSLSVDNIEIKGMKLALNKK